MNKIQIAKISINIISIVSVFVAILIQSLKNMLWDLALIAVFLLMCIRPLNDLFPSKGFIKLMPLRKNLGILSATIIVIFGLIHYLTMNTSFLTTYFSIDYWGLKNNQLWAHLGELTGVILLITSNKLSMRILKRNWKRIQRLSYVYFFSGAIYVFSEFGKTLGLISMIVVFELTLFAFIIKRIPITKEVQTIEND